MVAYLFLFFYSVSANASRDLQYGHTETVPIHSINSIRSDLDNKTAIIEALVIYPNSCYQPLTEDVKIIPESKAIYLFHFARLVGENCTMSQVSPAGLNPQVVYFYIQKEIATDFYLFDGATGKPL